MSAYTSVLVLILSVAAFAASIVALIGVHLIEQEFRNLDRRDRIRAAVQPDSWSDHE